MCIIGDTGAGKSSLFNAIIGDMIYVPRHEIDAFGGLEKEATKEEFKQLKTKVRRLDLDDDSTPIRINGTLGYVEQKSWIQNKTIRENILFGLPLDESRYHEIIKACQLTRDL